MTEYPTLILTILFALVPTLSGVQDDLGQITKIYVDGNNMSASVVRGKLKEGFQCLELARKREEADAVLTLQETDQPGARDIMMRPATAVRVSGLLEDLEGGYLWDFTQRAVNIGVKPAANEVLKRLAKACDCKRRIKKRKKQKPQD